MLTAIDGVALICYVFAQTSSRPSSSPCSVGAFEQAANSTRMAIIARAFEGEQRVHARAVLRTVTNVAIAAGSGLGALALLAGTAEAYRGLIVGAGALYLLGLSPAREAARLRRRAARARAGRAVTTATGSVDASADGSRGSPRPVAHCARTRRGATRATSC